MRNPSREMQTMFASRWGGDAGAAGGVREIRNVPLRHRRMSRPRVRKRRSSPRFILLGRTRRRCVVAGDFARDGRHPVAARADNPRWRPLVRPHPTPHPQVTIALPCTRAAMPPHAATTLSVVVRCRVGRSARRRGSRRRRGVLCPRRRPAGLAFGRSADTRAVHPPRVRVRNTRPGLLRSADRADPRPGLRAIANRPAGVRVSTRLGRRARAPADRRSPHPTLAATGRTRSRPGRPGTGRRRYVARRAPHRPRIVRAGRAGRGRVSACPERDRAHSRPAPHAGSTLRIDGWRRAPAGNARAPSRTAPGRVPAPPTSPNTPPKWDPFPAGRRRPFRGSSRRRARAPRRSVGVVRDRQRRRNGPGVAARVARMHRCRPAAWPRQSSLGRPADRSRWPFARRPPAGRLQCRSCILKFYPCVRSPRRVPPARGSPRSGQHPF